jgi:hypothetical protein
MHAKMLIPVAFRCAGKLAARLVENGLVKGEWVLLQNCHLSISWMPELEKIVEDFEPDKINKDFRLWCVVPCSKSPSKDVPAMVGGHRRTTVIMIITPSP